MLKWILIITTLISVQMQPAIASSRTTGATTCVDCMNSGRNSMDALREFTGHMNAITDGALRVDKIVSNKDMYAPKCEKFVDDGEFKKLGEVVIREVNRPENASLYRGTADLIRVCPNYKNMSKSDRDGMWVLFTAGWAQKESRCEARPRERLGPRRKNGKKRGILSGILQLDKNREHLYKYGELCDRGDSLSPEKSLRCSFSMLTGLIELGHPLFSNGSYWEVLRPNAKVHKGHTMNGADTIKASLRKYSPCTNIGPRYKVSMSSFKPKLRVARRVSQRVSSN